ncbi:Gfo/Idh/MocA family protein [Frondihabitans australicus]|uniref:Oxidoreductase family protein n=1 Tax=Frondihabitans australicus TaxID=386892 RepID=A0A495IH67_9MICO|nr:Gfo/Idh/MocA family oxidoreductase [Frondihabitans australicus]RKR75294.1 oxidoreductase family protein [Frondihabitans australicus]
MTAAAQTPPRRRYALVGAGSRAQTWLDAITGSQSDVAELVAVSDCNEARARWHLARLGDAAPAARFVRPDDLAGVIEREAIDRVIATTPDFRHAHYIDLALRAGADVVVEKPLTIDAEGVRTIARAVAETGREVVVTFNYRYSPRNAALKSVVASGAIGTPTAVHFEWVLDSMHGADYFRRWHREREHSGGLQLHKASHHFDLVNWWLGDSPRRVFLSGGLRFYGDANAARRGLGERPARGTHDGPTDPFQLDLRQDPRLRALYLDAEPLDGYLRDRDVFSAGIDVEDTLSAVVDYTGGASMSYSLTTYAPWEGYRVAITGTEGRAELDVVERAAVLLDGERAIDPSAVADDGGVAAAAARRVGERLVVQRLWEAAREVPIESGAGGHGGGDALLMNDVFRGPGGDPLGRAATWADGVRSVAVGIAGNRSLQDGRAVTVDELGLGVRL